MVKAIPMEDWLRGCVHHDGRHGYVTLPCDEVLKIADFIERLRADRKTENCSEKPNNCTNCECTDDCTECKEAEHGCKDEPQTYAINPQEPTKDDKCFECDDFFTCDGQCDEIEDEPQTNADQHTQCVESVETMSCQECKHWIYDDRWGWFCPLKSQDECRYEPKDEPQREEYEEPNYYDPALWE